MKKFLLLSVWLVMACNQQSNEPLRTGRYRPQFHFTPPTAWMNDPNGMVYHEGKYHLFYQYYPDSTVWGPMHWGHAVSKDLLRWEDRPIALYPDSLGYIFSGSAVLDKENSSGLGTDDHPPLVALFTYHDPVGAESGAIDFQYQGLAYSTDDGATWTKYAGNPVLKNPGIRDFRDPKVMWHGPTHRWIMTLAVADHVRFYSSPDLKQWTSESEFGREWGAHGGVWECPDLFPLAVEGSDQQRWVLLVSINPGGPQGGSATQYFIGDFDGSRFVLDEGFSREIGADSLTGKSMWIDHGADNYAGVTWSNAPGGRRIFLGWLSNWQYAQVVPTREWRSAMTLPRELALVEESGRLRLHSRPIAELESLLGPPESAGGSLKDSTYLLEAEIQGDFAIQWHNAEGEVLEIRRQGDRLALDRRRSGQVDFHPDFASQQLIDLAEVDVRSLDLFMDTSSIEVFINDGERVLTTLVFPTSAYDSITWQGELDQMRLRPVRSIW